MITHSKHKHSKISKFPKVSFNICFLELTKTFPRDAINDFESATVNELALFKSSKFNCI